MYYVYLLKSERDQRWYIGYTKLSPERRLTAHNSGLVMSTKSRRPLKLIYLKRIQSKPMLKGGNDFSKAEQDGAS